MSAVHRGSGPRDPPPQTKNKKISQRFHLSGFMCGFDKMGADNVKGSGRRICLARPCGRVRSVRSAIQRAEKGSGLRTRSFQATQALQSGTHREPFYYLSVSLSNSTRNVKDAWQEPTNWSHLEHLKKKRQDLCALQAFMKQSAFLLNKRIETTKQKSHPFLLVSLAEAMAALWILM